MTDVQPFVTNFTEFARTKLSDSLGQIERCLNLLSTEQIWHRPNDVSNAVGNLMIHLNGNVRMWIVDGLGGETYERDRQAEFDRRDPLPTEEIFGNLRETVDRANGVISSLTSERLAETVTIQDYEVTGLEVVFHVVEHFTLHAGQIVYATKILTGKDLSLYDSRGHRIDGQAEGTP